MIRVGRTYRPNISSRQSPVPKIQIGIHCKSISVSFKFEQQKEAKSLFPIDGASAEILQKIY